MSRWVRFFIILLVGFGAGLLYGWVLDPVEYVDTFPETLREDYQADYILMVAEAYQGERDLDLAVERLTYLGFIPPESLVENAMYFAVQNGYAPSDLGLLRNLSEALKDQDAIDGGAQP